MTRKGLGSADRVLGSLILLPAPEEQGMRFISSPDVFAGAVTEFLKK